MRRGLVLVALWLLVSAVPARAELIDFGGGLIYDTVQDLTWLDPFYAQPPHMLRTEPVPGACADQPCDWYYTWVGATTWVAGLSYESYDDWRLPDKFLPGSEGGDNEFHLMLEQLSGWEFDLERHPLGDPHLVTLGDQGPFLSPLEYWFVWTDEPYIFTSPFAGVGYDFPDSPEGSAAGRTRIMAVRRGAPFSRVPEPSTFGFVAIAVLGAFARVSGRRAIN